MARPIPIPSVPIGILYDNEGRKIGQVVMETNWYDYFKAENTKGLSGLSDVKLTALANGDAPVWDAVLLKWTNQAN